MAKALHMDPKQIVSVRHPQEQLGLGIPKEVLEGHAIHWINIEGYGAKLSFKTEVFGRETYAWGLLSLAKNVAQLANGSYSITELVSKNFFTTQFEHQ